MRKDGILQNRPKSRSVMKSFIFPFVTMCYLVGMLSVILFFPSLLGTNSSTRVWPWSPWQLLWGGSIRVIPGSIAQDNAHSFQRVRLNFVRSTSCTVFCGCLPLLPCLPIFRMFFWLTFFFN